MKERYLVFRCCCCGEKIRLSEKLFSDEKSNGPKICGECAALRKKKTRGAIIAGALLTAFLGLFSLIFKSPVLSAAEIVAGAFVLIVYLWLSAKKRSRADLRR